MLVLSCKLGERIVLPGIETTVDVVAIQGKVARLGISAPAEVVIHRAEVRSRIADEPERVAPTGGRKMEN